VITYGGVDALVHVFLTLYSRERAPGSHSMGGLVDPGAGLGGHGDVKILYISGTNLR
jgi:hypothetical protein